MGGRDEQIAQVADGVMLDVVHVAQTPQGGVVERVGAEGIEVDPLEVDPARMALVGLEVQLHARPSSPRPRMGVVTHRTDAGAMIHGTASKHGVEVDFGGAMTARAGDRVMAKLARLLSRAFFRRIDVEGTERMPAGPVVLVANHVNGLVDGLVLMATLPRYPRFLGKTTLYRILPLAPFLHLAGVVPVHRTKDAGGATGRRRAQRRRLAPAGRCWPAVASWRCSPKASATSEGAAAAHRRSPHRASAPLRRRVPGIETVAVGLVYDDKARFRSRALVRIGEPEGIGSRRGEYERDPVGAVRSSPTTSVASSRRWRRCTSHVSRSWPGRVACVVADTAAGQDDAWRWARPSPTDRRRPRAGPRSRTPPRPTRPTSRWWAWTPTWPRLDGGPVPAAPRSLDRRRGRHGHRWPRRGGRPRGALRHHEAGRERPANEGMRATVKLLGCTVLFTDGLHRVRHRRRPPARAHGRRGRLRPRPQRVRDRALGGAGAPPGRRRPGPGGDGGTARSGG